jgi:hypothetical protein
MRTALDEAKQALTAIDRHMDQCMSMMGNMHGEQMQQHNNNNVTRAEIAAFLSRAFLGMP